MSPKEFVTRIQDYYGPYRKGQMAEIARYLQGKHPVYLDTLYRACLLSFSSKWRVPPDIAIFEEFSKEAATKAKQIVQDQQPLQIEEKPASKEAQARYWNWLSAMFKRDRKQYPRLISDAK